MSFQFRACTLDQPLLLAPSLQQWLPEGHLARFIADVTEQLDLSAIYSAYDRRDGRGQEGYHPLLMTRLLLYGYCVGVASSRALERRAMRMWRSAIWQRTSIRITTPLRIFENNIWPRWEDCLCRPCNCARRPDW
jgi:Transposase and inactivated derivatives